MHWAGIAHGRADANFSKAIKRTHSQTGFFFKVDDFFFFFLFVRMFVRPLLRFCRTKREPFLLMGQGEHPFFFFFF